ncbi:MAG TPA: hypothetical protein HPP58_04150 [Deltaproteobacteria bacterium]|nr:hypothetical protein [Deltaproteobacteria bacterium]
MTLLKGIWTNPWGVDLFDLDFLTILTAYLFLSSGQLAAGSFALGQGILIDLFSAGLQGLFPALYLGAFWGITIVSRFVNLREAKGQAIIVAIAVLFKQMLMVLLVGFFSRDLIVSFYFFKVAAISILGSGIIAPLVFMLLNGLRAVPPEDEPDLSSGRSIPLQEPLADGK